MPTFERGFEETERAADATAKTVSALLATVKQLKKASRDGDISAIRRANERMAASLGVVRQEVANAASAWPFSQETEEQYLRDLYEQELLDMAAAAGMRLDSRDGRLVAFPSVIRIQAAERAIKVDKTKVLGIRPSRVVSNLKANQTKKPRFASERFLEALYRAYRLLTGDDGDGRVVPLVAVYDAFTLLPGVATDYGPSDFARDLFLLDRTGPRQTKGGTKFSLPAATGTKGGKALSVVAPDGELVTYYGIRFG